MLGTVVTLLLPWIRGAGSNPVGLLLFDFDELDDTCDAIGREQRQLLAMTQVNSKVG